MPIPPFSHNNPNRIIETRRRLTSRIGTTQLLPFEEAEYFMELTASQWNGVAAFQMSGLTEALNFIPTMLGGVVNGLIPGNGPVEAGRRTTKFLNDQVASLSMKTMQAIYAFPICQQMTDNMSVRWETHSLVKETSAAVAGTAASVVNRIGGNIGLGLVNDLKDGLQIITGLAPNEFMTVLFKGPSFKEYTLTWTFSPNDQAAAHTLLDTIRELNAFVAPGISDIAGSWLWTYPSMFDIAFRKRTGALSPYLYKFKTCICKNLSVNYAGSGLPTFYTGGYPETVIISMSFQEISMWTSDDFDENWPQNP